MNRSVISRSTIDTIFALTLLVIAVAFVWEARSWEIKARLFPWVVGFPAIVLLTVYLGAKLIGLERESRGSADVSFSYDLPAHVVRRRGLAFVAWIFFFLGAVWLFGFQWGGTVAALLYLLFSARERWPLSLAVTVGIWAAVWILANLLYVPFPRGVVFELLGL